MLSKIKVTDMKCAACVNSIEKAVNRVDGVVSCRVNLIDKTVIIEHNCDLKDVKNAIKKIGYSLATEKNSKKTLIISCALLIFILILNVCKMIFIAKQYKKYLDLISLVLSLSVLIINFDYIWLGIKKLVFLRPNMNSLVAVGSLVSFAYGVVSLCVVFLGKQSLREKYTSNMYFSSSSMIVVIVSLGKFLEEKALNKTKGAIENLVRLTPNKATILVDGKEEIVDSNKLKVGDILVVKSGNKISADGIVIDGKISVDQSAITGESLPISLNLNEIARNGTTVVGGYAQIKITAVGQDTTLGKIIELVSVAGAEKVPSAKIVDSIAGVFVPIVFGIAIITFAVWCILGNVENAFNYGISVLVVSCPCALGLATPVAVVTSVGASASRNIIIKNGSALEYLSKAKTLFFDKTGTLTYGKMEVTNFYSESDFFKQVYEIEKNSSHPTAKAICEFCENNSDVLNNSYVVEEFETETGFGVSAKILKREYKIGNTDFVNGKRSSQMQEKINEFLEKGTCIIVSCQDEVICAFLLNDKIREGVKELISELKTLNVKTVMLTGDNKASAENIRNSCGMGEYYYGLLPQEKSKIVEEEKEKTVFVGDGINDAPSMVKATVGVAVGSGTDVAIDNADVILLNSEPSSLLYAIKISRATIKNIKQNLFWAFFYNMLAIPIACGVFYGVGIRFSSMIGSVCMSLSSLCVVLNALRLRKLGVKSKKINNQKGEIMKKRYVLTINAMMCNHCVKRVTNILNGLKAEDIKIDLATKIVEFYGENIDLILDALEKEDYKADEVKIVS